MPVCPGFHSTYCNPLPLPDYRETADPSVLFHDGRWYLYPSCGMGAYVADAPLGEFRYQPRNPILRQTAGLVRGPGHGCIVRGPRDTLWAFYTCTVCYEHIFNLAVYGECHAAR